jgi:hypothetical protein
MPVTVTIPPRSSGVLVDQYQEAGGEVFARGNITARTSDGKPAQGAGTAATQDDGNYGVSYQLNYTLNNPSKQDREVQVLLTSPRSRPDEQHGPLGGEMTLPLRVNGNILNVRVDDRGDGVQIARIKVPAGQSSQVFIDLGADGRRRAPVAIPGTPF